MLGCRFSVMMVAVMTIQSVSNLSIHKPAKWIKSNFIKTVDGFGKPKKQTSYAPALHSYSHEATYPVIHGETSAGIPGNIHGDISGNIHGDIIFGVIPGGISGAVPGHPDNEATKDGELGNRRIARIPSNDLPIPVPGPDLPDDQCGDAAARFPNGTCHALLRQGPCKDPFHWVTLNPKNFEGQCSPRLCGRSRVFVGESGTCRDIYDPHQCRGGRRLYYTAYGDPICDCPIGQYPFPGRHDACVSLFTRGPCQDGHVVAIDPTKTLRCTPKKCNGRRSCGHHNLGLRGSCSASGLYTYDVFRGRPTCANIYAGDSPYFKPIQEIQTLDAAYNQHSPGAALYSSTRQHLTGEAGEVKDIKRQDSNTGGILQVSSALPDDALLNPCRPGAKNGNNLKCTNPIGSETRRSRLLDSVRSAFSCAGGMNLQASTKCGNSADSANCGPSYQLNTQTGQCRQSLG